MATQPSSEMTFDPVSGGERKQDPFGAEIAEQYLTALRRHRWLVGGILIGALILGLVITLLSTPLFTSTSRIEISRTQDNVTNVEGLQDEANSDSLEFYQTQYSLLESRSLAELVARSQNLAQNEQFLEAFDLSAENDGLASGDGKSQLDRDVTEALLENISIQPIRGSSLVDISFTSPYPELSARITNSWTEQFIQSNLDRRFASSEEAREFLQEQLADLRQRLEQSEAELVAYASDKRIIALSTSENSDGETRTERTLAAADLEVLNTELARATAQRISAQSALRAARGVTNDALANSAINGLRLELGEVQAEHALLLTQFEDGYPGVVALQGKIDALEAAIAREEARVRANVQSNYQSALSQEQQLRAKVEGLKSELIGQRRDSIQYAIFQREVDTNRQLYDALLQRNKEIGVAGVGSNNVQIVDRAEVAQEPSSPILPFNLAVSLLLGLVGATAVVLLLELMDQNLKDPHDLDRKLGIALLGSIPRIRGEDILESLDDRKSTASEAYLSIKTNLGFITDHGVPRSFMVTSTAANEGKSFSSLALARSLARTGSKVLLVDGDMRNPSVSKLLGLESADGLSNALSGQREFTDLIAQSEYDNLSVMDSGPTPPNAAELLSGSSLTDLITLATQHFDHVVIDSPPVLGLADAPLISSAVEGVVFAIEADRHHIRGVDAAVKRLRSANANIFGGIVTKLEDEDSTYGYGYAYSYQYGGQDGTKG